MIKLRNPGDIVKAFAGEIAARDVRRLEFYLADQVAARFDIAGELSGRSALIALWRRTFQTYALLELHIAKTIIDNNLVLAESVYLLGGRRGAVIPVKALSIFEVESGAITQWRDHADLSEVPVAETDRWRRLSAARW